jgi:hypothetical protein
LDQLIVDLIEMFPTAVQDPMPLRVYPLHDACMGKQSERIIMKLLEIFPAVAHKSAVLIVNGKEKPFWPLPLACAFHHSEVVIRRLVDLNLLALDETFLGWYPIHLTISFAVFGSSSNAITSNTPML